MDSASTSLDLTDFGETTTILMSKPISSWLDVLTYLRKKTERWQKQKAEWISSGKTSSHLPKPRFEAPHEISSVNSDNHMNVPNPFHAATQGPEIPKQEMGHHVYDPRGSKSDRTNKTTTTGFHAQALGITTKPCMSVFLPISEVDNLT